ncbi:peptidylprolyl isomerase [Thermoflavimicrobium daqui]|jgi:foldase protein PrsA|nr:peptidylprolyl isomerase [Thermoflavimicrobium daqui]
MWQWNKRVVTGLAAVFLGITMVLTGCNTAKTEDKDKKEKTQAAPKSILPLDTSSKKVIGEYQNGKVTEGELHRFLNLMGFLDPQIDMFLSSPQAKEQLNGLKEDALKQYTTRQYILSKAKPADQYNKKIEDEMKKIEDMMKQNPTPQATGNEKAPKNLDEAIKGKGFTKDEFRAFVLDDLRIADYLDEQLKKQEYDHVKVNHILVSFTQKDAQPMPGQPNRSEADAKKRIEEVKKKLDQGGDFAKLAKEYSDDPGSKDKAGLVEGPADQFVPEFAKAAKTIPLNQISDIVKTEYGFHILKVTERKKQTMDKAPDQFKGQQRQKVFTEIMDKEVKLKSLLPKEQPAKK